MKKIIILYILYNLSLLAHVNCSNYMNINGDFKPCPTGYQLIGYTANLGSAGSYDYVEWQVTNGHFNSATGPTTLTLQCYQAEASQVNVVWDDIAKTGRLSFKIRNKEYIYGFADIEILSVKDKQVDDLLVKDFTITSNTISIPKGKKGTLECSTYLVYPSTKGISHIAVEKFRWNTPASWGGGSSESTGTIKINYNETSGDGEKITVTPIGCNGKAGSPRSITVKRTDEPGPGPGPGPNPNPNQTVIENRIMVGRENHEGDSLKVKNVWIFGGANVTFHGQSYVNLQTTFNAFKGSNVHITSGGANPDTNYAKSLAKISYTDAVQETGVSQNYPNPCHGNTKMDYFLPESLSRVSLCIVSSTGEIVKNINIYERGEGTLTLNIAGLPQGFYLYYLMADGIMINSKRMIIAN